MRIGYHPFDAAENDYVTNMKQVLSEYGVVSPPPKLSKVFSPSQYKTYDVLILNWSDNNIVSKEGKLSIMGCMKMFIKLFLYRIFSKKTIFVRHNLFPHNTKKKYVNVAKSIVDIYEKFFDLCWVHSGHLELKYRLYIPHPLYEIKNLKPNYDDFYYVIFGRILPYKKIEEVLCRVPIDINIKVYGSAPDKVYLGELQKFESNKNININAGYISADNVNQVLASSSGLIISHADTDMIVSGSIIYGISVGIPVFCIDTPFIDWFNKNVCSGILFSYSSYDELLGSLPHKKQNVDENLLRKAQYHFSMGNVSSYVKISFETLGLIKKGD